MDDRLPLLNFFAFWQSAPQLQEQARLVMTCSKQFDRVWSPEPGWLVGARALPADASIVTGSCPRIIPGEGLDHLLSLHHDPEESLSRVEKLVRLQPACLAQVPGDFMFAWLGAHGRATAVRACSGRIPVYVYADAERCAIATRLEYLVRFVPKSFHLDPLATGIWLTGWYLPPDQRSLLQDVYIVQAGHFAQLEPGKPVHLERYWDPRPSRWPVVNERKRREHASRLREELVRGLKRDLSPTHNNLLWLSGGVDSSALACLAAQLERPLTTLTFLSRDARDQKRDLPFVKSLRHELGVVDFVDVVLDGDRYLQIARNSGETCYPVRYFGINALDEPLRRFDVSVVFGGEFADEVGGSRRLLADWLAATTAWRLPQVWRELPQGHRTFLTWAMRPVRQAFGKPADRTTPRDLAEIVQPEVHAQYQAWRARRRRAMAADERPYKMLSAAIELNGWLVDYWEGASQRGVQPSSPFYSRAILELAFECHPHEQLGRMPKQLLRRALHEHVPHRYLWRKDKAFWSAGFGEPRPWREAIPAELDFIVREDMLQAGQPLSLYTTLCLTVLTNAVRSIRLRKSGS